jgi:hypothetical protein
MPERAKVLGSYVDLLDMKGTSGPKNPSIRLAILSRVRVFMHPT